MSKRIIVSLGDIHIRLYKYHDVYKVQFEKLYNELSTLKPDRIIVTGDVVHSKIQASPEMFDLVSDFFNNLAKYTNKVIVIPGNHDAIVDSERMDALTPILKAINNEKIIYYTKSGVYQDEGLEELVYCVWSCLEDQKSPDIETWQEENDPNLEKQYVALYHGVLNGAKNSAGFSFEFNTNSNEFYRTDVAMLSDIHQYQSLPYNNFRNNFTEAVYSSSLIQQDFGESIDNHGFVKWTLEDDEWEHEMVEIDNEYAFHTIKLDNEDIANIFKDEA